LNFGFSICLLAGSRGLRRVDLSLLGWLLLDLRDLLGLDELRLKLRPLPLLARCGRFNILLRGSQSAEFCCRLLDFFFLNMACCWLFFFLLGSL